MTREENATRRSQTAIRHYARLKASVCLGEVPGWVTRIEEYSLSAVQQGILEMPFIYALGDRFWFFLAAQFLEVFNRRQNHHDGRTNHADDEHDAEYPEEYIDDDHTLRLPMEMDHRVKE